MSTCRSVLTTAWFSSPFPDGVSLPDPAHQAGWPRRARFFDIYINGTVSTYKKLDSWGNWEYKHQESF